MNELKIEFIDYLINIANKTCKSEYEDFNPSDGGNFDDTYYMGTNDGEIILARRILEELGYVVEDDEYVFN